MFLQELKKFSRENWWVYLIIIVFLPVIYINGKGNIVEIFLLIFFNLMGNVAVMAAIGNYSEKKNKTGAIFHLTSTFLFTSLGIYGFFFRQEAQYLIWQICFTLAAIKAITFYNFEKDLQFLNSYSIGILNILFLAFFIIFGENLGFYVVPSTVIMALGFSFVTTGLVSVNDSFRYWGNYIGTIFIILGSAIGSYTSYMQSDLNGLYFGYLILTFTAFVYFSKLLPKYLK